MTESDNACWPIFAFETDRGLYWSMLEHGNRHGTGEGWLTALPWGTRHKHGGIASGDNRVSIDSADVIDIFLLGWTRPMKEFIAEHGEPIRLES